MLGGGQQLDMALHVLEFNNACGMLVRHSDTVLALSLCLPCIIVPCLPLRVWCVFATRPSCRRWMRPAAVAP